MKFGNIFSFFISMLFVVGLISITIFTLEHASPNAQVPCMSYLEGSQPFYSWAVIGAGPAGIISVGQLLEHGVSDHEIVWIDPEFLAGRMGKYYGKVPSNQKAYRFTTMLDRSSLFSVMDSPAIRSIRAYDQQQEHPLQLAVDVLHDLTRYLCTRVVWHQDMVQSLWFDGEVWWLVLGNTTVCARKVILATGSHPKTLDYTHPHVIPLDHALDEEKLQQCINHDDTVMVVGSAHSAILVMKYVYDFGVKKIINIYTKEPTFGMFGGLEGITAYWAKNVLLDQQPSNIMRTPFDAHTLQEHLSICTKVVYACGYEPNEMMVNGSTNLSYDPMTGVIAQNLYGVGIAFPQYHTIDDGNVVSLVGFCSFMQRAQELMPIWMRD